jgi:hypothetical protein
MTNDASDPCGLPPRVRKKTAVAASTAAMRPLIAIWRAMLLVAAVYSAVGCAVDQPLTANERNELQDPPAAVAADVERLQPGVARYIGEAEQSGLRTGRPLSADELKLAANVGVTRPELVRIVVTGTFPLPSDAALATELKSRIGLGSTATGGLTLGHAIFIAPKYASARWLLAHELTHVGQFETMGVDRFAHDYLVQLLLVGYVRAPLEQAAHANEHLGRE